MTDSGPEENTTDAAGPLRSAAPINSSTPDVGTRIRYQAARRDATSLVVAALHTDALPWTAVEQKNKGRKLDLLTGYIEQVTQTLLTKENDA